MTDNEKDNYVQDLLNKIATMAMEIANLSAAYTIADKRLNTLSFAAKKTVKELLVEAARMEDASRLAVEASKSTEQSALLTNDSELIVAAKNPCLPLKTIMTLWLS